MGFCTKKYSVLFVGIFLLGSVVHVKSQSDSVNIRCVAVDSAGDVTLTWVLPPSSNLTTDGCQHFSIESCTTISGTYGVLANVGNLTNTDTTINQAIINAPGANFEPIYFYASSENSNTGSYNSNIVSTIYLQLTNNIGTAFLLWNAISNPLPQGSSKWYQIWREYKYVWSLVDSTQLNSYTDTITYCDSASLKYQVRMADSTICVSTSNIAGSRSKFICTIIPPQVVMDTVSVTPAGNSVDITWQESPKKNVVGYIVYKWLSGNNVQPDTVHGRATNFLLNYTGYGNPSDSILTFTVAAFDSCGNKGAISNPQNTLWLRVKQDTCAQTNTLNWNPYQYIAGNTGGNGIGGYKIFSSINSGPFHLIASLDPSSRSYTDSNLRIREQICYYVQVYDSAYADTTASSNIVCDSIFSPIKPKNNYLRTATVLLNTSSILIVGYIDSTSGAGYYAFERSTDSSGGYSTIYTMTAPQHTDSISYIDTSGNPVKNSYLYRIITLNSCYKPIDSSNLGQTMLLNAVGQTNSTNTLTWNDYRNWYDAPSYYLVYRSTDEQNYSLISSPILYTNAGQNTYTDNFLPDTAGQGIFYYYIKAVENNSPALYPFTDTSLSNVAKAYQDPIVYIPDAFDPNGKNNIFKPVGVFVDVKGYDFSILNRWGQQIFESNDPNIGWNGKAGSKGAQEGVYIYLLTYTSSKGEYFQMKGTVTLIK